MNSRDRVMAALEHEEPDVVPLYEGSIENVAIAEYFGGKPPANGLRRYMRLLSRFPGWRRWYSWSMRRTFVIKAGLKRQFDLYRKVGIDLVAVPAAFLLTKCRFPTWDTYVDELGRQFRVEVFNGVDQLVFVGGMFAGVEDYDEWGQPDPFHPARVKTVRSGLRLAERAGFAAAVGVSGVVEASWEPFGFERFSRLLYHEPKFVERLLDERAKFAVECVKLALDEGAELLLVLDDMGYKGRTFLSPKAMERLIFPRLKRIVDAAKRGGAKVILHSCGDITEVFDRLVELGFDAFNPIEPTAGMDVFELNRRFGDRVTFIGNVSPQLLATGTPEQVVAYSRRLISEIAPGGGLILASGHSINPQVKLENYLAMLRVARGGAK
ncbi:MAG: hypothetical protein Kow0069_14600 [Promethearchaeota archaeon]